MEIEIFMTLICKIIKMMIFILNKEENLKGEKIEIRLWDH